MLKLSVVFLHFAVVAVSVWSVNGARKDESAIMQVLQPIAKECAGECGLDEENKNHKIEDDIHPCFKRCFMRRVGLLDDDGKYNRNALHDAMSQYTDDKEEAKKFSDQFDGCFDAKGDNLGDDEDSEMKRADILFECLKEMKEVV